MGAAVAICSSLVDEHCVNGFMAPRPPALRDVERVDVVSDLHIRRSDCVLDAGGALA